MKAFGFIFFLAALIQPSWAGPELTHSELQTFIKKHEGEVVTYNYESFVEKNLAKAMEQFSELNLSETQWQNFIRNSVSIKLRTEVRKATASLILSLLHRDPDGRFAPPDMKEWKVLETGKVSDLELSRKAIDFIREKTLKENSKITDEQWGEFLENLSYGKVQMDGKRNVWASYLTYPLDRELKALARSISVNHLVIPQGSYIQDDTYLPAELVLSGTVVIEGLSELLALCFESFIGGRHFILLDEKLFETDTEIGRIRAESIIVDEIQNAADREFFPEILSPTDKFKPYLDREVEIRSLISSVQFLRDAHGMSAEEARADLYHQLSAGDLNSEAPTPTREHKKLEKILERAFKQL